MHANRACTVAHDECVGGKRGTAGVARHRQQLSPCNCMIEIGTGTQQCRTGAEVEHVHGAGAPRQHGRHVFLRRVRDKVVQRLPVRGGPR